MAKVTVGVPVYNGEQFLDACLECLRQQTYRDFVVLIHDNASTDGTAQIAMRYCSLDPRFFYHRHHENLGFVGNFLSLINASSSEYFCLRAHDDISSNSWIEESVFAMERDIEAMLAVSAVRVENLERQTLQSYEPPSTGNNRVQTARALLQMKCFSWFYGLWRREYLASILDFTLPLYRNLWGLDMAILFPAYVSGRVAETHEAVFISRVNPNSVSQTMLRSADLAFKWSYQRAYAQHVRRCFREYYDMIPVGITDVDVERNIRTIVGKRRVHKAFVKQPWTAAKALYASERGDFHDDVRFGNSPVRANTQNLLFVK